MRRRTYEDVKQDIENEGYKLLSTDYKNNVDKLKMECTEGHIFEMQYRSFQSGSRCHTCKCIESRISYDQVKQTIENEGYKLLSTDYKNSRTKIEIQCPSGHIFEMRYNAFQQGNRCPECYGSKKHTYSYVKQTIENEGYKLLSTEYKNVTSKLKIQCPEGHIVEMTYSGFYTGNRCADCSPTKKLTYDQVKQVIEKTGYKLLSTDYKNNRSKLEMQCPEGHIFEMTYNAFQLGVRCPICNEYNATSKGEKELVQYVSEIYNGTIVENDRNTIVNHLTGRNLELDIFLPDINKAIEYNGTYWHSDKYVKIKDKIKRDQCKELGIDLLVIEDTQWTQDKSSCLTEIKDFVMTKI